MGAACGVCGKSDDDTARHSSNNSEGSDDDNKRHGSSSRAENQHSRLLASPAADESEDISNTTFSMRPEGRGYADDEYSRPGTPSRPLSPTTNKNFSPHSNSTRRPHHHLPALEVKHNHSNHGTVSSSDLGGADATYTNMPGRVQSEEQTSALVRASGRKRNGGLDDSGEYSSDAESDTLDRKRASSARTPTAPNKNTNPLATPPTHCKVVQAASTVGGTSFFMGARAQPTKVETPRQAVSDNDDDETGGGSSTCSGFSSKREKTHDLGGFEADGPLQPHSDDSSPRTTAAHTRSSSGMAGASGSTVIMAGGGGGPSPSSFNGRRRNSATIPPEQDIPDSLRQQHGRINAYPSPPHSSGSLGDGRRATSTFTNNPLLAPSAQSAAKALSRIDPRLQKLLETAAEVIKCAGEGDLVGLSNLVHSHGKSIGALRKRALVPTSATMFLQCFAAPTFNIIAAPVPGGGLDDNDENPFTGALGRELSMYSTSSSHHRHRRRESTSMMDTLYINSEKNLSSLRVNDLSASDLESIATGATESDRDDPSDDDEDEDKQSSKHHKIGGGSKKGGSSITKKKSSEDAGGGEVVHSHSTSNNNNRSTTSVNNNTSSSNNKTAGGGGSTLMKDALRALTSSQSRLSRNHSNLSRPSPQTGGGFHATVTSAPTNTIRKEGQSTVVSGGGGGIWGWVGGGDFFMASTGAATTNGSGTRGGGGVSDGSAVLDTEIQEKLVYHSRLVSDCINGTPLIFSNTAQKYQQNKLSSNTVLSFTKPQERQRRKWLYQMGMLHEDGEVRSGEEEDDIPDVLLPSDAPIHAAARSGNADMVAHLIRYTSKSGLMEGWQLPHHNQKSKYARGSSLPPTPSLSPRSQQLSPATSHHNIQNSNSNLLGGGVMEGTFLDEGPLGKQNRGVGSLTTPSASRTGSPFTNQPPPPFRPPSENPFGGGGGTTHNNRRPLSSRLSGAGFRNDTPTNNNNNNNPPAGSHMASRNDSASYEGGGGVMASINSLSTFYQPTPSSNGGGVASALIGFMLDAVRVSTQPTIVNPNSGGAINPFAPPRPRSGRRHAGVEFSTDMIDDDGSSSDVLLSGTNRSIQHLGGTTTSSGLPPLPRLLDSGDLTSHENSPQAVENSKLLGSNTSRPTSAQESPGHTPIMPPRPRSRSDHHGVGYQNTAISKVGINEIHLGRSALQDAILAGRPKAVYELISKHGAATTYPGNMVVPAAQLSTEILEYADHRLNEIEEELYGEEMHLQQLTTGGGTASCPLNNEESEIYVVQIAIQKLQEQRVHWTRIYDYGSRMLPSAQQGEIRGVDMGATATPPTTSSSWAGAFLLGGINTLPKLKSGMDFDVSKVGGDRESRGGYSTSVYDDEYDVEEESPTSATVGGTRHGGGSGKLGASSRRGLPDIGIAKQLQTLRGSLIAPSSAVYDSSVPPPTTTSTPTTTPSSLPAGMVILPASRHRHVTPHVTLVAASTLCSPAAKLDGTVGGGVTLTSKGPMSSTSLRHRVVEFPQIYRVCNACRAADGNKVILDARQLNATAFGQQPDGVGAGDAGSGQSPPPTSGKGSQIRTQNILAVAASGGHARTATGHKGGAAGGAHFDEYTGSGIEPASNDADLLFGIIPQPSSPSHLPNITADNTTTDSSYTHRDDDIRHQLQQQLVPVFCPFCCVEEQPLHTAVSTGNVPIVLLLLETVVTAVCNVFGGGSDGSVSAPYSTSGKTGKGSAEASAALAAAAAGRQRSAGGGGSSTASTVHYIEAMLEAGCTSPLERLRFLQQNRRKAAMRSGRGSSAGGGGASSGVGGGEGSLPEGYLRMIGLSPEGLRIIGAFVNMRRFRDGFTALHIAASAGNNTLVKLLLEHNADPFVRATPISLEFASLQLPPLAELVPEATQLSPIAATSNSSTTTPSAAARTTNKSTASSANSADPAATLLSQLTKRYVLLDRFKGISASEAANSAVASYLKLQGAALRIQHGVTSSSSSTASPRGGGVINGSNHFLGSKAKKASQTMQSLIMGGPMLHSHQLHHAADNNHRPSSVSMNTGGNAGSTVSGGGVSNLTELFQLNRSKMTDKERQGLGSRGSGNGAGVGGMGCTSSSMGATNELRTQSSMSGGGGGAPRVVNNADSPPTPPSQLRQSSFARQQVEGSVRQQHERLSGSAQTHGRNSGNAIRSTGELPPLKR